MINHSLKWVTFSTSTFNKGSRSTCQRPRPKSLAGTILTDLSYRYNIPAYERKFLIRELANSEKLLLLHQPKTLGWNAFQLWHVFIRKINPFAECTGTKYLKITRYGFSWITPSMDITSSWFSGKGANVFISTRDDKTLDTYMHNTLQRQCAQMTLPYNSTRVSPLSSAKADDLYL